MKLKEAKAKVDEIKRKIEELVKEAETICDEAGASFYLNIAYGMGGTYVPSLKKVDEWSQYARDSQEVSMNDDGEYEREGYYDIGEDGGWYTSSMSC